MNLSFSASTSFFLQVAVVEVSSFQMEIPHKNFCPSVSEPFFFLSKIVFSQEATLFVLPFLFFIFIFIVYTYGLVSGFGGAKPYAGSFG